MRRCQLLNPGLVEYGKAWGLQKELFYARSRDEIIDTLVLLQHSPVYTFGRRSPAPEIPLNPPPDIFHVDRGGGATYHGPGQIVGYPIIELKSYTTAYHAYLRMLEGLIIRTLADFGIESQRIDGYTGVWVKGEGDGNPLSLRERDRMRVRLFSGERKIASIGVRIVRGITMHGFALNVNNDLGPFDRIIPCNIKDVKMTSMSRILGASLNISEVEERLIHHFAMVFGVLLEAASASMADIREEAIQPA